MSRTSADATAGDSPGNATAGLRVVRNAGVGAAAGPASRLPAIAMVVIGSCCIVLGGLVAAVTGPLELGEGSWTAAYLVLVCGVGQYVIGTVQRRGDLARPVPASRGWAQLSCWNLGNLAVIVGTLVAAPAGVDVGAALLLIALAIALHAAGAARIAMPSAATRSLGWAYRGVLAVLLVSVPIGVILAYLRHGS